MCDPRDPRRVGGESRRAPRVWQSVASKNKDPVWNTMEDTDRHAWLPSGFQMCLGKLVHSKRYLDVT